MAFWVVRLCCMVVRSGLWTPYETDQTLPLYLCWHALWTYSITSKTITQRKTLPSKIHRLQINTNLLFFYHIYIDRGHSAQSLTSPLMKIKNFKLKLKLIKFAFTLASRGDRYNIKSTAEQLITTIKCISALHEDNAYPHALYIGQYRTEGGKISLPPANN